MAFQGVVIDYVVQVEVRAGSLLCFNLLPLKLLQLSHSLLKLVKKMFSFSIEKFSESA